MENFIAKRRLQYSLKGSDVRKELVIRLCAPYLIEEGMVDFPIKKGFAGCHIEIDGLNEKYPEVYGADSLQAINIASNIEPFLERLSKKYDLYFLTGEPYF